MPAPVDEIVNYVATQRYKKLSDEYKEVKSENRILYIILLGSLVLNIVLVTGLLGE